ncbi:DUF2624 domain-containing protein [Halobacillus sp. A1]|uniref:DUF2624 domain-containing protein n=1 Tax=Halobacillus sp. A1 TaxID=2880262 RepID=UPI0020A62A6C|nr:DUF2624 domain-containing protein [Halobacillus sp. A1]MCP3030332.1 DUF2624 domain-containing protein [Halobacillus sp. A1]
MLKQYITHKLKNLTVEELLYYSKMYNISISRREAEKIVKELRRNKEDPFEKQGRKKMLKKLSEITSAETAHSVDVLLHKIAKQYGLEEWLH